MPRHPERLRASRRAISGRRSALAGAIAGAVLILASCTGLGTPGVTSASPSSTGEPSAAATTSPTPTAPAGPALVPDGTAEENLPLFAATTAAVWSSPDSVSGRAYIDALAAAGFDKAAMQVTEDQSTVGNPVESLQFSVRWGDQCLIGQVGPAVGAPVTVVVPVLAEGTCLVGRTRPIDW